MLKTRFTDLVGCTVPIQQAGMGPFANPRMAAAVSNAGGLGMVSCSGVPPALILGILDELQELTAGVFGVNFIIHFFDPALARECVKIAAQRAKVVDFFYGDPDDALVEIVHAHGALACWQVGSREEAMAAEKAGCDFIIAQGIEAGGHVRGRIGLLALLGEVLDAVKVPVLAAGGIGTGHAMAAALSAGADGVRVGTRLVATDEADAHPEYVQALIAARAQDTVYTDAFSGGWPNAPHRVLRSSLAAAQSFPGEIVGERVRLTGERVPLRRLQGDYPMTKQVSGALEAMPHWAGESVSAVKRVQPAAEIVRELAAEAEQSLRRWC